MERDIKEFMHEIAKVNRNKGENRNYFDYLDGIDLVIEELKPRLKNNLNEEINNMNKEVVKKDKHYLKKHKDIHRDMVTDIIMTKGIHIKGYEGNKIYDFIE